MEFFIGCGIDFFHSGPSKPCLLIFESSGWIVASGIGAVESSSDIKFVPVESSVDLLTTDKSTVTTATDKLHSFP